MNPEGGWKLIFRIYSFKVRQGSLGEMSLNIENKVTIIIQYYFA